MKTLSSRLHRHEWLAVAALLLMGSALRLLLLGRFPPGLNQDEASAGYEAWALLHYGMDRCGHSFPVLLTAWGSGQNALYSYLSIPLVALFGLSPLSLRLTAGLWGCVTLFLFYDMARRLRGRMFALWALLVLSVNPWHVLACRWALESNLLPGCLLAGLYFLLRAREREGWLYAAAAALGLSLYAYGTAYFFLLFFLPCASVLLLRRRTVRLRTFLLSALLFLLLALPITACHVFNALGHESVTILGVTLPQLTESRQSAVSVFGGGGWSAAWGNFKAFVRLLWRQSDGLVWNSAGPFGLFYGKVGLALAALGLGKALWDARQEGSDELYVLLALLCAFLSSFFIDVNVNRMNMAFLPLLYCQARGLSLLGRGRAAPVLGALALGAALLFTRYYFTDYAEEIAPAFYAGLGEAIDYAGDTGEEALWVSWDVNMPYIYVLFYRQVPPEEFCESVEYLNPQGAFRWVRAFSSYRFGNEAPGDGTLSILRTDKLAGAEPLAVFGQWAVTR